MKNKRLGTLDFLLNFYVSEITVTLVFTVALTLLTEHFFRTGKQRLLTGGQTIFVGASFLSFLWQSSRLLMKRGKLFPIRWVLCRLDIYMYPQNETENHVLAEFVQNELTQDCSLFVTAYMELNKKEVEFQKFLEQSSASYRTQMEEFRKKRQEKMDEISKLKESKAWRNMMFNKKWDLFSNMWLPLPMNDRNEFIQMVDKKLKAA